MSAGAQDILLSLGPWKKPLLVNGTVSFSSVSWLIWPLGVTVHAATSKKKAEMPQGLEGALGPSLLLQPHLAGSVYQPWASG